MFDPSSCTVGIWEEPHGGIHTGERERDRRREEERREGEGQGVKERKEEERERWREEKRKRGGGERKRKREIYRKQGREGEREMKSVREMVVHKKVKGEEDNEEKEKRGS